MANTVPEVRRTLTKLARGWLKLETDNRADPKRIGKWTACVLCSHDDVKLVPVVDQSTIHLPKPTYSKHWICQLCGCSCSLNQVLNLGVPK